MTSALQWLGMKENQVEDNDSNKTFLENLNSMALGAAGGLLIIIFIILGTLLMKQMSEERKKKMNEVLEKLQIAIVNGIHQTINNGSIPIQVTSMFQIKSSMR